MTFAQKLKFLRNQNHYTQQDLAQKLTVSRKTVSSWESGRNYPDIKIIIQLSNIYGISTDGLLKDQNNMKTTYQRNKWKQYINYFREFFITLHLLLSF